MSQPDEIAIFCANIAYLRKTHGLSKREMCHKLHISFRTLQRLEEGILPPGLSSRVVFYVAREFGILPANLFRSLEKS